MTDGSGWRKRQIAEQGEPVQDDYKAWYEEAMAASNEAGYVGFSAAETIRELDKIVSTQPAASVQEPLFADIIAQHPGLAEELKSQDKAFDLGYQAGLAAAPVQPAKQEQGEPVAWNRGVPSVYPQQKEGETFIVSYKDTQSKAKQEQGEPVIDKSAAIRIATALGWTPPKQEQGEPVAWIDDQGEFQWIKKIDNPEHTAFYTTPQQRKWVGLTAEEREQVQAESYGKVPHHVALIAAVEAKLKQKNGFAEENT